MDKKINNKDYKMYNYTVGQYKDIDGIRVKTNSYLDSAMSRIRLIKPIYNADGTIRFYMGDFEDNEGFPHKVQIMVDNQNRPTTIRYYNEYPHSFYGIVYLDAEGNTIRIIKYNEAGRVIHDRKAPPFKLQPWQPSPQSLLNNSGEESQQEAMVDIAQACRICQQWKEQQGFRIPHQVQYPVLYPSSDWWRRTQQVIPSSDYWERGGGQRIQPTQTTPSRIPGRVTPPTPRIPASAVSKKGT